MARTAQAASMMYRKKFAIALAVIQTMLIIVYTMYSRFSDDPAVIAHMEKLKQPTEQLWDMGNHYAGTYLRVCRLDIRSPDKENYEL